MKNNTRKGALSDKKKRGRAEAEPEAVGDNQEGCRCKEVSKKSLPELLKVVIGDLSFRKKKK